MTGYEEGYSTRNVVQRNIVHQVIFAKQQASWVDDYIDKDNDLKLNISKMEPIF